MTIEAHLLKQWSDRLQESPFLMISDPDRRYESLVDHLEPKAEVLKFTDSTLELLSKAWSHWYNLADDGKPVVVWLPWATPETDLHKQEDPFSVFRLASVGFPDGPAETYESLCRAAFPLQLERLADLFAHGVPSFALVNALEGGPQYVRLKTLWHSDDPIQYLKGVFLLDEGPIATAFSEWKDEFVALCQSLFQFTPAKLTTWSELQREFQGFLLFSEFVLDLPGELPVSLKGLTRAPADRKTMVDSLCQSLRNNLSSRDLYVDAAVYWQEQWGLKDKFKDRIDLGRRETFPFENLASLRLVTEYLLSGDLDTARKAMAPALTTGLWNEYEQENQAQWALLESLMTFLSEADEVERSMTEAPKTLKSLVVWYEQHGQRLDSRQRELVQRLNELPGSLDDESPLTKLWKDVQGRYLSLVQKTQGRFLPLVKTEGWPASGLLRQGQIYSTEVHSALQSNQRTAYLMVDAFRYELAAELARLIEGEFTTTLVPACAALPTKTPVGMASLILQENQELRVTEAGGRLVPQVGDHMIVTPTDRDNLVVTHLGDQVKSLKLEDLAKTLAPKIDPKVRLLLVKSQQIDSLGENLPDDFLTLLPPLLQKLRKAVTLLAKLKFQKIVLSADHGFLILHDRGPGSETAKPQGQWPLSSDRYLLGKGQAAPATTSFPSAQVGIVSDLQEFVVPTNLSTFRRGVEYCHGGLSLQEAIIPVLTLIPKDKAKGSGPRFLVELSYRNKTLMTTWAPLVDLKVTEEGLGLNEDLVELELKIEGADGQVVGEIASGPKLDPTSGTLKLYVGEAIKVPLRIREGHQGPLILKALNAKTQELMKELTLTVEVQE